MSYNKHWSYLQIHNRPTWELKNMVKALSFHSWSNTTEEKERLEIAKLELLMRRRRKTI